MFNLWLPVPIRFFFHILLEHFKYHQLLNMLRIKRDINQEDFKIIDLHFVKSEYFHPLEVVDRVIIVIIIIKYF